MRASLEEDGLLRFSRGGRPQEMERMMRSAVMLLAGCVAWAAQFAPESALIQVPQRTLKNQALGFEIGYPVTWSVQEHDTGVIFRSPDPGMPIAIRVFASGERDLDSFFANYLQLYILKGGLGFLPSFEARIEPTMYGSWRGDTVHGRGTYMGLEMILAATAIRANNQIYLFQMLTPVFRSEEAYRQRERMARSLQFQSVPEQGRTTAAPGAVCTTCGAALSQTMEVLKGQTLRMMR